MNKKRFFLNCLLIIIGVGFSFNCKSLSEQSNNRRAWTYMFYDAADFTPGYDPMENFCAEMYGHKNLHVVVLRDVHSDNAPDCNPFLNRSDNDSRAAYFEVEGDKVKAVRELGEVNMGSATTLANFITFAKENYPADRYILAFYDHGGGYSGSCVDDTDNDWLTMVEKREALQNAGNVDIVIFTAPCLMGSLEAMYEIRDYTKVYIGSEDSSGYCFWYGAIQDTRKLLEDNPAINTFELGREIIRFVDLYRCSDLGGANMLTMSAVRCDKVPAIVTKFSEITQYYMNQYTVLQDLLKNHYHDIQTYWSYNMDLYDLAERLLLTEQDPSQRVKLNELKTLIIEAVLNEAHGSDNPNSKGIALYCPKMGDHNYNRVSYTATEFTTKTQWDELLGRYFENTLTQDEPGLPYPKGQQGLYKVLPSTPLNKK